MKRRSNRPVNADARGRATMCVGYWARAGYRERYVHKDQS
jgi:hypothetical protein